MCMPSSNNNHKHINVINLSRIVVIVFLGFFFNKKVSLISLISSYFYLYLSLHVFL